MQAEDGTASPDYALVSAVLAKDRKATAEFVSQCADWTYPFVRYRLQPRSELVDDLMQEIVLAAWQSLPSFRGEADLRSWIMGIARHKLDDHYRRRIRAVELSDDDERIPEATIMPGLDQGLDLADQQRKVQRTLAMLPEPYALALLWQYRDEKSVRQMAQLAGKTEKGMERLLARARESFRRTWSDDRV